MEKRETLAEATLKIKDSFSLRQLMMVLIVILGAMANIITDWIKVGYDATLFQSPAYWISLVIGQGAIAVIMLSVRSFMIEREENANKDIKARRQELAQAHGDLASYRLTERFDDYVYVKNRIRKLTAYLNKMQRKIFATRFEKRRKSLTAKLEKGKTKIDYIKQKYDKIRIVEIFSHTRLSYADDESLSDGYSLATAKMLINKVVSVVAFGVLGSTLTFQPSAFGWGILVSTFIKLFQVVFGVYCGGSEGVRFVQGSLLSALESRAKFVQGFIEKNKPDNQTLNELEVRRNQEELTFAKEALKARESIIGQLPLEQGLDE